MNESLPADRAAAETEAPGSRFLAWAFVFYAVSTLVSMAVMSIGAAVLLVALVAASGGLKGLRSELRGLWEEPWVRRYVGASLALWAACALSLGVAKVAPLGWAGKFVRPQFSDLAKIWYFAWPLLLAAGLRRIGEGGRRQALKAWLLASGAISAIGCVQYFTGWPRPQPIPGNEGRYHATMFLGHHLSTASILIFPFFAALDLLRKRASRAMSASLLAGVALLGFSALILSYSRMLWAALPVGLAVWVLGALPRRKAIVAVVVLVLGAAAVFQVPAIQRRALDAMGTADRQLLWKANLEFLRLRPLTGTGFRRNLDASSYYLQSLPNDGWVFSGHAHNNLIDMLGGTGLLGAAAWLVWCGWVFWLIGSLVREPSPAFAWGLLCAWIVFHLNGLTQVNFWEGKVMHQMMWTLGWAMFWKKAES